jgi:hypothetical protein
MLVGSLAAYRMEGNPLNRAAFCDRFRLRRMAGKDWLWTIGLLIFMMASAVVLSMLILSIIPGLLEKGFISLPDNLPPMIDPRVPQDMEGMKAQLGGQVEGNWSLVVITLLSLVLNIFGEELVICSTTPQKYLARNSRALRDQRYRIGGHHASGSRI